MSSSTSVLALTLVCLTGLASAQQFRIESEVFINHDKEPVAESLTLFSDGIAYDFMLNGNKEIAILDLHREQFVMLDVQRQLRLTLSGPQVLEIVAALRAELNDRAPDFAEPGFQTSYDEKSQWLTLSSDRITYRAQGSPAKDPGVLTTWRKFVDWSARLNATLPGRMPPFPRLELNEALFRHQIIPRRVEVVINPERGLFKAGKIQGTTRHINIWQLSKTDRDRIDKADLYRATFKPVGLKQFRQLPDVGQQPGRE